MNPDISDPLPGIGRIQLPERDVRHSHLIGIRPRQKSQPEHLKPVYGRHPLQVFIHRAHQHLPPEAVDGVRRLPFLQQPVQHADAVEVFAPRALAAERQHRACDRALIGGTQTMHPQKGTREVKRCRQAAAPQDRKPSPGLEEVELAIKLDAVPDSQPLVKIQQVDATAQQDVLAVVDDLFHSQSGMMLRVRPETTVLQRDRPQIRRRPARPPRRVRPVRRRRSELSAFSNPSQ